ncbi:hypothetical protein BDW75DRAFT_245798 [Aspergillus navahoensis]
MPDISLYDQYAELMNHNPEGRFLYIPQRYSDFHPGSVGYFDRNGGWNEITDLSKPELVEKAGFTKLDRTLTRLEPMEAMWKTRSSESEKERNIHGTSGLSGAMAAAPVDISGEGKYKTSSTAKAALITGSVVKHEKFKSPFGPPIQAWVKDNGNRLVKGDFGEDIGKYGLWAIQATWITQECAITMTSGRSHDINLGLALERLGSVSWAAVERPSQSSKMRADKGLVVSFSGVYYKLRTFSKMFSSSLLKPVVQKAGDELVSQAIVDENGNIVGYEDARPIRDEKGDVIEYEKVNMEAERAKTHDEKKQAGEVRNELEVEFEAEYAGLTEEDIQAEKEYAEQEKRERAEREKQERARREEEINQIPDEKKRREEWIKFLTETVTVQKVVQV